MSYQDWRGTHVTVGEIAEIADVTPGAVSNWRRRHADFPSPAEETPSGDRFDLADVVSWLEKRGKKFRVPQPDWDAMLWRCLDTLRGSVRPDEALVFLLQVMLIGKRALGGGENSSVYRECWEQLRHGGNGGSFHRLWEECVKRVDDPEGRLGRVLRAPPGIQWKGVQVVVEQVESMLMKAVGDAGSIAKQLLERLHEATAKAGGAVMTPATIAELQLRLLQPIQGDVYDPACGAAVILGEAWRHRSSDDVRLWGQDVNEHAWRIGYLHLALSGADFNLETGDTLRDDRMRSLRADRIFCDPPFGLNIGKMDLHGDDRWAFGIPGRIADWAWAQVALYHLAEGGRAVLTMPLGGLFRGGHEATIRERVLRTGALDVVVELPPGLYQDTGIPVALLLFDSARQNRSDRVLFVDAHQLGEPRRGGPRELASADIDRVVRTVEDWRAGEFEEQPRFAASAKLDTISEADADLTPRRYVQYTTRITKVEGEPLLERLERLKGEVHRVGEGMDESFETLAQALELPTLDPRVSHRLVRLGDVLLDVPGRGVRQRSEGTDEEHPYIEAHAVSGGSGILRTVPRAVTRGKVRDRLVQKGDVLLMSRGIGPEAPVEAAVVGFSQPAAYSQALLRLTPDTDVITPEFLFLFVSSRQGRMALAAATTGSVVANLRPAALKEIEVRLPSLDLQHELSARVREVLEVRGRLSEALRATDRAFDTFREAAVAGVGPHAVDEEESGAGSAA